MIHTLANMPFDDIRPGLPVISATGKPGRVVSTTAEGEEGPIGRARYAEVEIEWYHRDWHSHVFHHQCHDVTVRF